MADEHLEALDDARDLGLLEHRSETREKYGSRRNVAGMFTEEAQEDGRRRHGGRSRADAANHASTARAIERLDQPPCPGRGRVRDVCSGMNRQNPESAGSTRVPEQRYGTAAAVYDEAREERALSRSCSISRYEPQRKQGKR